MFFLYIHLICTHFSKIYFCFLIGISSKNSVEFILYKPNQYKKGESTDSPLFKNV